MCVAVAISRMSGHWQHDQDDELDDPMTTAAPNRSFIRHVVFFSAKDQSDVDRIVEGLSALAAIPHSRTFEVVRNKHVDALSDEVDVIVYAEFDDDTALAAYKADPIYAHAITVVRPLRELRLAADF